MKLNRQKPVKGGRKQLPSCVLKEIRIEVEKQSRMFKVSRSFVVATALAEIFGIKQQEDYKTLIRKRKGN